MERKKLIDGKILISLEDLKRIKLSEDQLKLTVYLCDYYITREKQNPNGLKALRKKCEYLLGYEVSTK